MSARAVLIGILLSVAAAAPAGAGTVVFTSNRCEDAQDRERRAVKPYAGAPPDRDFGCIDALWTVSDDGTGLKRITDGFEAPPDPDDPRQFGGEGSAAWSGDGRTIVFSRIRYGETSFWALTDGVARRIPVDPPVRRPGEMDSPSSVSPDGTWFAFTSLRGVADGAGVFGGALSQDIWTVSTAGGAPKQLTSGPERDFVPEISPDGRRIFFLRAPDRGSDYSAPVEQPSLYAMNTDGSGLVRLTTGVTLFPASRPSFSPDGSYVALALADGLYTMRTDGAELTKRLSTPPPVLPFSDPVWAGDGPTLVFVASVPKPTIFRVDLSLPVPLLRPLTLPDADARRPDWTEGGPSLGLPVPLPDVDPPVVVVSDPTGGAVVTPPVPPLRPAVRAAAAKKPKRKVRPRVAHRATFTFFAIDRSGLKAVDLSVSKRVKGGRCVFLGSTDFGKPRSCTGTAYRSIATQRAWKAILERLEDGDYRFRYRTKDVRGRSATSELPVRLVP